MKVKDNSNTGNLEVNFWQLHKVRVLSLLWFCCSVSTELMIPLNLLQILGTTNRQAPFDLFEP